MKFRTEVEVKESGYKLDYNSRIWMLGSCFAENIGCKLQYYRFGTDVNPSGILYNPLSIARTLEFLLEKRIFTEGDLLQNAGKWVSLYHHGSFSAPTKEECLGKINSRLMRAQAQLPDVGLLILTFGTSWVYRHRATGLTVANCHRFPAADFERYRLTPELIAEEYRELTGKLRKVNPGLRILFTVSPIRHWKDGAHENQISKAVLLLAIEELIRELPETYYFPAYEIVMDELRDYRFYEEDMLHISSQAVDYIWEKFESAWIASSARPLMQRIDKLNKSLAHRPFAPESETYKRFRLQLEEEMEALRKLGQNIDFSSGVSVG